ncbi:MAG: sigma-70 family RNA polymerase sigma factor [Dehalococcoidia bacterium]|nr:sigma-70 family RNA polymerase sigma factor [Dehalococcoidia bacterium]
MSSEENLVRQAVDGNQQAFTQLYDEHFDRIYRYIYFRVTSQAEAEDLTQEVFLKALQAIGSYKWRDLPFAAWLFRIAHNQVIDHLRKRSKQKKAPLEEAAAVSMEDPVAMTEHKSEIEELTSAVKELPSAQQEVISLRFISGLPIAEVAKTLGKSEGTVKALQFNGTVSLRRILAGKGNG